MKTLKKDSCPCCNSKEVHTMGLDQFCLDCDWMNSSLIVESGLFEMELLAEEMKQESPPEWASTDLHTEPTHLKSSKEQFQGDVCLL